MADTSVNGQRKEFDVVGKPNLPGKLSPMLATGKAKFGIDYTHPDMVQAKFLRSPYANAVIKSIDTSAAKALPGVVAVWTWEDENLKPSGGGRGGGMGMGGGGSQLSNIAAMEDQEVGAIVIAENEDICDEALRLLKIEWDVKEPFIDIVEIREKNPPAAAPAGGGRGMGMGFGGGGGSAPGTVTVANNSQGNAQQGLSEADHVIEYSFNMPAYSSHIPNPAGSLSFWFDDPASGQKRLHIEGAVQMLEQAAGQVGQSGKAVQEGLFQGGKYCDWGGRKAQMITPLLSQKIGRPVRCICSRKDMYDFGMNQRLMKLKVGFKKDGLVTAVDDYSLADNGVPGSSSFGSSGDQGYGPWLTTKCTNINQKMDVVSTNRGKMYTSGQHCPFNWDNMTMAFHLIAEKLNMDPIEVATKNIHGPSAKNDPEIPPSYQACINAGKELMKWKWHQARGKKLPDGRMHGASFRYQLCPRHAGMSYSPKLFIDKEGVVHMPTKGPCTGIYAVEGNAGVVAEEMGIRYEDVSIDFDYRETFTPVGGGSDGTTASAWATKECANQLKQQLLQSVAPLLKVEASDLEIRNRKIFSKSDPSKSIPFAQAAAQAASRGELSASARGIKPPAALWPGASKLDTMNIAMCEVAVDEETGAAEVLRFVVAADPGKIIRRTSLESQIDQVLFFSSGCQLSEDYFFDKATGLKLNANMFDYKKPTILDFAQVDKALLETRAGNAAYGANGISHSLANTHLIICAIQNAIGKWVDPPATPDKILKALGKA